MPELCAAGLQAIEAYHHTPPNVELFLDLAARYGLLVTGGSDFPPSPASCCARGVMGISTSRLEFSRNCCWPGPRPGKRGSPASRSYTSRKRNAGCMHCGGPQVKLPATRNFARHPLDTVIC